MTGKWRFWRSGAAVGLLAAAAHGQCPGEKVISSRPWERGAFGRSVQIESDVAVVADPHDQTYCFLCGSGAVHTFRRVDGAWRHEALLFHSRISERDGFGGAISLDGPDRFAASAGGEDVLEPDAGAVYVFEHNGEAWHEVAEILPVEPQWQTSFGPSLLLRGDTLIVGQPKFKIAEGFVGAAWVYRLVGGRWEFSQKLMAPDPRPSARFGNAMAMDGEWLIIGAPWDDEVARIAGAVYLYRRQAGGSFELVEKVRAPNPEDGPEFGSAVSLDGERLAVGAPNSDGAFATQGAVFVYSLTDGQWKQTAAIYHEPPGNDALGASVALHGDLVVAGAPNHRIPGVTWGAAFAFRRRADGTWFQAAKFFPSGPTADFGDAIATDGATVIVGAPFESAGTTPQAGAAHIFDLGCLLCRADLDGDGELSFLDFLAFQNLFAAGDPAADFDGDGELTFFDFLAFQTEFAAGCP